MVRQMVKRGVFIRGQTRWQPFAKTLHLPVILSALCLASVQGCTGGDQNIQVKKLVEELGDAPLGFSSLGTARPAKSETTDQLISYGDKAVPALVEALNSESPVRVGYAAYCLKEIGTGKGVLEAESSLDRLRDSSIKTPEMWFAIGSLEAFLSQVRERR